MNEIKILKADHIELRHDSDGAQIFRVPAGFELPEGEVTFRKDGERLIIEPTVSETDGPKSFAELLDQLETIDVEWPDLNEGLLPLDDVKL